jgi:taurine dioxygenase
MYASKNKTMLDTAGTHGSALKRPTTAAPQLAQAEVSEAIMVVSTAPEVTRSAGSLGASVDGIDLSAPINDSTMDFLRTAFLEHCVLVIPKQNLTPDQLSGFAARWGELHMMPAARLDTNPYVIKVANNPARGKPGADIWHSDRSCEEKPPKTTFLLSRTLPSAGGDTMFANQYAAYDALSSGMKSMLEGLRAVHTCEYFNKTVGLPPSQEPMSVHPVVRTHPETGRRALFVNAVFTTQFEGMTLDESQPLLTWLYAHCSQPNFTFRHRWSVGDLVMWDNRCVQHFAVYDYAAEPRIMHRATVVGDDPA